MLFAMVPGTVFAAGIEPDDVDAGVATLSKTAERISDTQWKITLTTTVGEAPIKVIPTEVVFVLDTSGSMAWCTNSSHDHGGADGGEWCGYKNQNMAEHSRLAYAKTALKSMTAELNLKNVPFRLVEFNSVSNDLGLATDAIIDGLRAYGGTKLSSGIQKGIDSFTNSNDINKILVILADGDSNDGYPSNNDTFKKFKSNSNNTVYTIGYTFSNSSFSGLATSSDYVKNVTSGDELINVITEITSEIKGMIVDPMGSGVTLDEASVTVNGSTGDSNLKIDENGEISWSPADGKLEAGSTTTIEYIVELKDDLSMEPGPHEGVALNGNACLNYSVDGGEVVSISFPVPVASYEVGTFVSEYVFLDADGNKVTENIPTIPGDDAQTLIVDHGTPEFIWTAPAETLTAADGTVWYYVSSKYDEKDVNAQDCKIAATSGAHKLVNTYQQKKPVELMDIFVTKEWDNEDDENAPTSVKVQLYANGQQAGGPVVITEKEGWKYKWTVEYYEGVTYTVKELDVPENYTATVKVVEENDFVITNKYTAPVVVPENITITVKKEWKDGNSADRPKSVSVQLYNDGVAGGEIVTLDKDNNWTFTWTVEKGGNYTVDEINVPAGYTKTVTKDGDTFTITNSKPTTPATGDNSNIGLWILVAAVAAAGVVSLLIIKIRGRKA